jgi:hypothetical protein
MVLARSEPRSALIVWKLVLMPNTRSKRALKSYRYQNRGALWTKVSTSTLWKALLLKLHTGRPRAMYWAVLLLHTAYCIVLYNQHSISSVASELSCLCHLACTQLFLKWVRPPNINIGGVQTSASGSQIQSTNDGFTIDLGVNIS